MGTVRTPCHDFALVSDIGGEKGTHAALERDQRGGSKAFVTAIVSRARGFARGLRWRLIRPPVQLASAAALRMIDRQPSPSEVLMRRRLASLMFAAAATWACSQDTLNPDRAASLISGTEGFKSEAHFTIHTDAPMQSAFECLAQAAVERMPPAPVRRGARMGAIRSAQGQSRIRQDGVLPSDGVDSCWSGGVGRVDSRARRLGAGRSRLVGSNRPTRIDRCADAHEVRRRIHASGVRLEVGAERRRHGPPPVRRASESLLREQVVLRVVDSTRAGVVSWLCGHHRQTQANSGRKQNHHNPRRAFDRTRLRMRRGVPVSPANGERANLTVVGQFAYRI